MSIIVTGASGKLGRRVVQYLMDEVDPSELILVTRDPSSLAADAGRGADVRHGDFEDPEGLAAAFAGGERMLLISTDAVGNRVLQHEDAVAAAVEAGVSHVVYTSIVNPTKDNPAAVAAEHRVTEEKIRKSGLDWTFLRNSLYGDLQTRVMAAALELGVLVTNEGAGEVAYVARDDCAAAAAAVLTSGDHGGFAYDITGPELFSAADRAHLFTSLTGNDVELLLVDDESYASGLADRTGMSLEMARTFATFGAAVREGKLAVVSDDFHDLTGRKPASLREILLD